METPAAPVPGVTSVFLVFAGPEDSREFAGIVAATEDEAYKEIGKRASSGHPLVNPTPEEYPVLGQDPKSLDAAIERLHSVGSKLIDRIVRP